RARTSGGSPQRRPPSRRAPCVCVLRAGSRSRSCPQTSRDAEALSVVKESNSFLRHPVKEGQHALCDEGAVFLEGAVAGVEQMKLDVLQVAPVALGEIAGEQRVVLAPDHQGRRLVLAEQRLPLRIE